VNLLRAPSGHWTFASEFRPGNSDRARIDAKFPQEDYQRLLIAQETGDQELAKEATKALEEHFLTYPRPPTYRTTGYFVSA